jgi:hypothetical protein
MDAEHGEVVRIFMESLSSFAKEKIRSIAIDEGEAFQTNCLDVSVSPQVKSGV